MTDINKIKVKCDQFRKAIYMMESEYENCITMAEKKNYMRYMIKDALLNVKVKQQVKS